MFFSTTKFVILFIIYVFFFDLHKNCLAQSQTTTNTNAGSKNTFSYTVQSTYGVTTSANASANFKVENEAILKLKAGSFVTNKFGNDQDQANAVFTATPTGGNVDLQGISAKNLLLIDDGTYFHSTMKSVDNPDPTQSMQASATAQAVHTSTIQVESGQSTFSQSFSTSF
jgi:hypothetical protein